MVSLDRSGCVKGIWGRTEGELKVGGHEIKYGQVASCTVHRPAREGRCAGQRGHAHAFVVRD